MRTSTGQLNDFTCAVIFNNITGISQSTRRLVDKSYNAGFWMGGSGGGTPDTINYFGGGILESGSPYGTFMYLPAKQWHQMVMCRQGTLKCLYGDGVLGATSTVSSAAFDTTQMGIFDLAAGGAASNCAIAQVLLWNRSLSSQEVSTLYQDPFAMFRPRPLILKPTAAVGFNPAIASFFPFF